MRWELFSGVAAAEQGGLCVLWYWRRVGGDGAHVMSERGFRTLAECSDDARKHGLTDEPINVVPK